jgi:hypothetical protein
MKKKIAVAVLSVALAVTTTGWIRTRKQLKDARVLAQGAQGELMAVSACIGLRPANKK